MTWRLPQNFSTFLQYKGCSLDCIDSWLAGCKPPPTVWASRTQIKAIRSIACATEATKGCTLPLRLGQTEGYGSSEIQGFYKRLGTETYPCWRTETTSTSAKRSETESSWASVRRGSLSKASSRSAEEIFCGRKGLDTWKRKTKLQVMGSGQTKQNSTAKQTVKYVVLSKLFLQFFTS